MDENKTGAQAAGVADAPTVTEPVGPVGPVGETGEPGIPYDEDAIVPEGWKPEPEGSGETEDKDLSELFGMKEPEAPENPEAKPEVAESVPEGQPEPPKEEAAPDYKAMYEELLRSTQDTKNRDTFRQVYAEQKAAGMSDAAARLVAKDAAGGQEFSLTDEADAPSGSGAPDYAAVLNQLHSVAPELKEIPPEVTRAIMSGGDAVTAYMGYQRAQDRKTIGELRAKLADMEKKAANTVQAVARGVSGNGAKQAPEDDFLKGMMDEDW